MNHFLVLVTFRDIAILYRLFFRHPVDWENAVTGMCGNAREGEPNECQIICMYAMWVYVSIMIDWTRMVGPNLHIFWMYVWQCMLLYANEPINGDCEQTTSEWNEVCMSVWMPPRPKSPIGGGLTAIINLKPNLHYIIQSHRLYQCFASHYFSAKELRAPGFSHTAVKLAEKASLELSPVVVHQCRRLLLLCAAMCPV